MRAPRGTVTRVRYPPSMELPISAHGRYGDTERITHMSTNTRPVVVSGRAGWFRANSAERMIADRRAFRTHGALSGRMCDYMPGTGILPESHGATLRESFAHGPVFVVFSYATPIAWIDANGEATVPDARYSVTTSRHQHTARMGTAVATGEYDRPADWDAS